MQTLPIEFSNWLSCDMIKDLPCGKKRGVYIIARIHELNHTIANPLMSEVLYIGETHGAGQTIIKRLQTFFKAARVGSGIHKHSGGNRFHKCFDGDLTNIYVAGYAPELEDPFLMPFIHYAERKLIWEYVVKWGRLPECNGC